MPSPAVTQRLAGKGFGAKTAVILSIMGPVELHSGKKVGMWPVGVACGHGQVIGIFVGVGQDISVVVLDRRFVASYNGGFRRANKVHFRGVTHRVCSRAYRSTPDRSNIASHHGLHARS